MTRACLDPDRGVPAAAAGVVKPLGLYMANVFEGRPIWPLRAGAPLERWI